MQMKNEKNVYVFNMNNCIQQRVCKYVKIYTPVFASEKDTSMAAY